MGTGAGDGGGGSGERRTWLVRRREEWRQVAIVILHHAAMLTPVFWAPARRLEVFVAACLLSFLGAVVIHNHMHRGIFHSKGLNRAFRFVLSFGALYPASANVPAHNLVHHHFEDDGQPDWAAPEQLRFRWPMLELLHFPNVIGPNTFTGVARWGAVTRHPGFERQYNLETAFAFVLTGLLLWVDFWAALAFVVLPQLYGARCILRINLIQHVGCDVRSPWNHSRNFVGRAFNWVMCNNGLHTIHHQRAGLHWADLWPAHEREAAPHMDPRLNEPSMIAFLWRTFVLGRRPEPPAGGVSESRQARGSRRVAAERDALTEVGAELGAELGAEIGGGAGAGAGA